MEFTNTFENGLSKDSNILLQPRGTYRDMNNGMLVSYDGNDYVIELPKGTKVSFTIPAIYDAVYTAKKPLPTVIGYISFIDTLIVFSTNSETPGYGEIGQVSFDKDGIGTYVPLYNHISLNLSIAHQITGFTFEENDKIKRVYWTDNYNQPRALNVKDAVFNNFASGDLINGQEYMVVGGAIDYNGTNYGSGLTAGNIFTANATTTYTIIDGSPKVYQYLSINLLSWYPDRINPDIDFSKYVSGSLYGGSKAYFVRLSNVIQGIQTSWSYSSFPINVYSIADYASYNLVEGKGAQGVLSTTTTGVEIKISNIDASTFDTIEVAVAEYDQANNVLRGGVARKFTEQPVTGSTMYIQHTTETGTEVPLNELTTFPASILRVKDITTNKNFNVIGNISEREELEDFTKDGIEIQDFIYYMPADGFSNYSTNAGIPKQGAPIAGSTSALGAANYYVTGGVVKYYGTLPGGVLYSDFAGDGYYINTFQLFNGYYEVYSGTPVVRPCIRLNKYLKNAGAPYFGYPAQKVIPLENDYFDYRGMAATQYLRQYWSGETYRFGILFYDKKGDPFYVRWIGDKKIQSLADKEGPIDLYENGGNNAYPTGLGTKYFTLKLNGVKINNIKISAEDMSKISGFSIVRAPRDKQYQAQGVLIPTAGKADAIRQIPLNLLSTSEDYAGGSGVGSDRAYGQVNNWYSPDVFFGFYGPASTGNRLEGDCFISQSGFHTVNTDEYNSKLYTYGGERLESYFINQHTLVDPTGSIASFFAGTPYDNNRTEIATTSPFSPEKIAVGCRTSLLEFSSVAVLANGTQMIDLANQYNTSRPLLNYKVEKSNLYGGQSKAALANTIYITTGHYQEITDEVKNETYDSATNSYIFSGVEVMGGDSFLGIYSTGKSLYDSLQYKDGDDPNSFSYGMFFPVESNINHYLRQGRNIQQYGMHNSDFGVFWQKYVGDGFISRPEQFAVNFAYTSEGTVAYPALPANYLSVGNFPYRVRWAGPKTLGETIDTFRTFPQNQFRDLDGNKGQINNVRNRDGKVFFWQDHAIGYLPMLEREIINGSIGEATQLGVSGVIDRFDNFNTYFGNQHKFGLIETEYGFAWFDFRRRAFLVMTVGGGIQEVSFIKGLRTFFNNPEQFYPYQLTNSGLELQNNDTPLLGIGISGVYDPNYKMTYMNFKWVEGEDEEVAYWKNLTVGYHHSRNVFVGFFDLKGAVWVNHNNLVIANRNIETTNVIQSDKTYLIGDTVTKNNVEYFAIQGFTTGGSILADQQPDYVPSVYWAKANQSNESHLLFSTLNFAKFFGQTYNHDIEFVINPKTGKPFAVDNLRQKSNDVNYDIIECTTDDDSVTESTNNKWYRYIDKSWNSSLPLGSKGRLVDFYTKVKFTFKNYTNNPANSRNLQKVFEFITSVFREKR